MAIYRSDSEIRVERSEKKTRFTGYFGFGCFAAIGLFGVTVADDTTDWMIVAAIFVVGLLLARNNFKRRNVCIIRPAEIGYGFIGGKMWWFDRAPVASVHVVDNILVQVLCTHADGVLRESFVLSNFDADELRDAFREAGIRVG